MLHKAEGYMRVLLLIFSALALMGAEEATPKRIVSTSLCGDSYVLWLVPETNIAALSWQADDNVSNAPQNMRGRPKAWDDIERLLALHPDLVVFGPGEGSLARPVLDEAGIAHTTLIWGEDFRSVQNNNDIMTRALGGGPMLLFVPNDENAKPPSILYLSSSGATAGLGTYVDAVIIAAGGENIITKKGWHTPDPETLVGLQPDLIITSFFKDGYASVNEAGLRNTVLQQKIKAIPHVNVPGKLWPCAGPGLYRATEIIAKAIAELP